MLPREVLQADDVVNGLLILLSRVLQLRAHERVVSEFFCLVVEEFLVRHQRTYIDIVAVAALGALPEDDLLVAVLAHVS